MRVAFIGAGGAAAQHRAGIEHTPGVELAGLVASTAESAARRAREWGTRAYDSLEELLDDRSVDAVHVLSPSANHLDHALRAIAAGKHVLVEKPVARTATEVGRIAAAAADAGVVAVPGHNNLHLPELARMVRLADEHALGTLRVLFLTYAIAHPAKVPSEYGGAFHDLFSHPVYTALRLLGRPDRVFAGVSPGEVLGSEDSGWMTLDYAAGGRHGPGATAHLYASWALDDLGAAPLTTMVKLLGTSGSVTQTWRSTTIDRPLEPYWNYTLPVYPETFVHQVRAFRDAVVDGVAPIATLADAAASIDVQEAARTAASTGRVVRFGP